MILRDWSCPGSRRRSSRLAIRHHVGDPLVHWLLSLPRETRARGASKKIGRQVRSQPALNPRRAFRAPASILRSAGGRSGAGGVRGAVDTEGMTIKRMADLFRERPEALPSDRVLEGEAREMAERVVGLLRERGSSGLGCGCIGPGSIRRSCRRRDTRSRCSPSRAGGAWSSSGRWRSSARGRRPRRGGGGGRSCSGVGGRWYVEVSRLAPGIETGGPSVGPRSGRGEDPKCSGRHGDSARRRHERGTLGQDD